MTPPYKATAAYDVNAIPYKENPDTRMYYEPQWYDHGVYQNLPAEKVNSTHEEIRTQATYGQPKGLRPLSDPLGKDQKEGRY